MATNLQEIVREIIKKELLLPDFQRKFVWTDVDRQKRLVASVLTKMPIGNLLALKAKVGEYAYRLIGRKTRAENIGDNNRKAYFLLDGQQRVTVLTNVFSSAVFRFAPSALELVSQTLKRRFFLSIPKYEHLSEDNDIFGAKKLQFPLADATNDEPIFNTNTASEVIDVRDYIVSDQSPFNPYRPIDRAKIEAACVADPNGFLIPLFMLIEEDENSSVNNTTLSRTIRAISRNIETSIMQEFNALATDELKIEYAKWILSPSNFAYLAEEQQADATAFSNQLTEQAGDWSTSLYNYLKSCVDKLSLETIRLDDTKRDRAIDIYENLNMGGVSLDIYDLILARVAKVYSGDFNDKIIGYINDDISTLSEAENKKHQSKKYPKAVLPEVLEGLFDNRKYNASVFLGCLDSDKNPSKVFVEAFLNLLSLRFGTDNQRKELSVDLTKKNAKLNMDAAFINSSCQKACVAIDRAMFFFNTRCGIRSASEINYKLMIDVASFVFWEDKYFKDKKIHKLLEAWYWASIFSGEFDKDQNSRFVFNLRKIMDSIAVANSTAAKDMIVEMKDKVLSVPNFSDEAILLYVDVARTERTPKEFLSYAVCQFYLSKTYPEMFDDRKTLTALGGKEVLLERHHIIPLGSATTTIKQSTKEIRSQKFHILNSPLNMVFITKSDNGAISDDSLQVYSTKTKAGSLSALNIPIVRGGIDLTETEIVNVLKDRCTSLKGAIQNRIQQNLN